MTTRSPVPLIHAYHRGPAGASTLVMIQGLGMHLQDWPPNLLAALSARHNLLICDNRDSGRSPQTGPIFESDAEAKASNLFGTARAFGAYTLFDMAADVVALIDRLAIGKAHLLGFSMGGMIAQIIAAERPACVLSLTSLMSSGGQPWIACTDEAQRALIRSMVGYCDRESAVEDAVQGMRLYGVKARGLSEAQLAASASASFDYAYSPGGVLRQAMAIRSSGDRRERLAAIRAPTLVVHGREDPCIAPHQAQAFASLVRGSRLHMLEKVGHDLADLDIGVVDALIAETTLAAEHG